MTDASITRLEPAKQFVTRLVLLNRYHAPDEDDYDEARGKLGAIHHGFPSAPVHQQAAHIVAGILEARPFAQANYRTACDYIADMLDHHGFLLDARLTELDDLGTAAWDRAENGDDVAGFVAEWLKPRIARSR